MVQQIVTLKLVQSPISQDWWFLLACLAMVIGSYQLKGQTLILLNK